MNTKTLDTTVTSAEKQHDPEFKDQKEIGSKASFIPTEAELSELKSQFEAAKQQKEFEELKARLDDILETNTPQTNEFEGAIQEPDTEKALQVKRGTKHFVELMLNRTTRMLSPKPVIGNLIAIGLAFIALYFLKHEVTLAGFGKYKNYIGTGLLIFGAIQVLKSSTRSLFIPMVTMIAGAIISHTLPHGAMLLGYHAKFFQYVMIAGIIGMGISVLTID